MGAICPTGSTHRQTLGVCSGARVLFLLPKELQRRKAALDAHCDLTMERHDANAASHCHTSGKNYQREWEARIGERGEPRGPVTVLQAALPPAL